MSKLSSPINWTVSTLLSMLTTKASLLCKYTIEKENMTLKKYTGNIG